MPTITIKGAPLTYKEVTNSHNRRAQQFINDVGMTLKKLGVDLDYVDAAQCKLALQRKEAWVSWYTKEDYCYYSYNKAGRFVDNMQVIAKLLEREAQRVHSGEITFTAFIALFCEEDDVVMQRKDARELLGVAPDCKDFNLISTNYKQLAKEHHPDMGGDPEMFKKINKAHKLLKKELA